MLPLHLIAGVMPKEGSRLNYRIIGFSFSAAEGYQDFQIEIAKGYYLRADSFATNVIQTIAGKKNNRIIADVPFFGQQYTWRITYKKDKKRRSTELYHFSTLTSSRIDTNKLRLRILQPGLQHKDAFVSVDAGGVLYDMTGKPVWFIPDSDKFDGYVADLQFTAKGTITYMYYNAFEIDYNGHLLWKAPNTGDVSGDHVHGEDYHHEFTRLSNGHYMVLGTQRLACKSITKKDTTYVVTSNGNASISDGYKQGRFGTIIEYDDNGNIVWTWESAKKLVGTDFDYYEALVDSEKRFDPHDNSFYFDESGKIIYLCFRNLNRILKISYPTGEIVCSYGDNFKPNGEAIGAGLFCNPHNIGKTREGNIYLFNNNSCMLRDSLPVVMVLKEPGLAKKGLEKIWEYTVPAAEASNKRFLSGGNVTELNDRTFFINIGSEYSKLFIVNSAKKILWSALPERLMEPDEKWVMIHEYRANLVTRQQLENCIWHAEEQ